MPLCWVRLSFSCVCVVINFSQWAVFVSQPKALSPPLAEFWATNVAADERSRVSMKKERRMNKIKAKSEKGSEEQMCTESDAGSGFTKTSDSFSLVITTPPISRVPGWAFRCTRSSGTTACCCVWIIIHTSWIFNTVIYIYIYTHTIWDRKQTWGACIIACNRGCAFGWPGAWLWDCWILWAWICAGIDASACIEVCCCVCSCGWACAWVCWLTRLLPSVLVVCTTNSPGAKQTVYS